MKKFGSTIALYGLLFILVIGAVFATNKNIAQKQTVEFTYRDLMQSIDNNQVVEVQIQNSSDITNYGTARVKLSDGREAVVNVPSMESFMDYIQSENTDGNINIKTLSIPKTNIIMAILPTIIMIILMVVLFSFMFQKMNGGSGGKMMSFGKSKAKVTIDDKNRVTFENVAGLDEEKEELKELVEFLREPKKFVQMGARIPKGVLLVGPPGTGKTLLAKAVAGEAYVPFFSISGSDFVEMFVGVGASRVRDLFEQAKKNSPCIVFIDEIDAVGRRRGAGLGGGHDEREQTLNQLLVEMDGFGANEGVIVLAATNRADILDPAILRPGRFDRQVYVGRPDVKGREAILKVHAKGKPLSPEVDLQVVAKTTSGFTGADLSNLLNEAALLAARHNKKLIDMSDIQSAFVKVGIGTEKKSRVTSQKEKLITAYHEAGHAILFEVLSELDPVHSISIIPTGMAGGYTMPLPGEDKMYVTKKHMEQEIVSLLGGRAAEFIVMKDVTTGASNDIERASAIARSMVTKYGMSDILGPIQFGSDSDEVFIGREMGHSRNYGEDVAVTIDNEVKRIVETAYDEAISLIKENIDVLHATAKALVDKEKITGDEFRQIIKEVNSPVEDVFDTTEVSENTPENIEE
ncbi:MAG: ATP-dependent zinc metalloprotease FtsH [Tyzzerella sp.]|uniref:ATP-dependent zinc metalloprotease FtsH n=1 Tax=Candidatus Fimicola merdigallinarum TaxID=2840819 RepID=A0A9D9H3L1_9FIRM|nr:ATP-dependent zinc metalloprotease FtsH [Candidatus Fimicola merdigallinarum]